MWKFGFALASFLWAQWRVLSYDLWMDSVHFASQTWYWRAGVVLDPQGASEVALELQNYVIDSVWWTGGALSYTYASDSLLTINLVPGFLAGDTVWVAYHGSGVQDPGGFGGLYWGPQGVFNIGVSLYIARHSYGRAWHPVVDSFGIKVPYRFHIRVPDTLKALCGGVLDSVEGAGAGWRWWHWRLDQPTSAYLASVAIGRYAIAQDTFIRAVGDTLPLWYAVLPGDSSGSYTTFSRLKPLLRDWERKFGPYPYGRVGYVAVSFLSGAMEHTANIAYPAIIMGGTQQYDWLWAHELMHSWFGNAVTGKDEREIWLKEGFATYGEALFYEQFFGKAAYYNHLRAYLEEALRTMRWEEGLFPLANIPLNRTYGTMTYRRSSTVVHTLRHQLGDSLFFLGLRAYQNRYRHRVVSTDSLLAVLMDSTGDPTLPAFFADWMWQPGDVHFRIDSFRPDPMHTDSLLVYWRISLRDKPSYTTPTRLTLYLRGFQPSEEAWTSFYTDGTLQGVAKVGVPFPIAIAVLNPNGEVADASTHAYSYVKGNTNVAFSQTYLSLRPIGLAPSDSVWIHVAHNWVGAYENPDPSHLSTLRYWQLDGVWDASAAMRGVLLYNGRPTGTGAYLDTTWLTFSEDSLALYWRPGAGYSWQEWPYYNVDRGTSATDLRGRIIADSLLPGEYALGRKGLTAAIAPMTLERPRWLIYTREGVLGLKNTTQSQGTYEVWDLLGRLWGEGALQPGEAREWHLPGGIYAICLPNETRKVWVSK